MPSYQDRHQQYIELIFNRDKIERDEHLTELIRLSQIDDQERFRELQEEVNKLERNLAKANQSKVEAIRRFQELENKRKTAVSVECQTEKHVADMESQTDHEKFEVDQAYAIHA